MIEQNPTLTLNINKKIFENPLVKDMVRIAYGGVIPRPCSGPTEPQVIFYARVTDGLSPYKKIKAIEEIKASIPNTGTAQEILDANDAADYILMMIDNVYLNK